MTGTYPSNIYQIGFHPEKRPLRAISDVSIMRVFPAKQIQRVGGALYLDSQSWGG